MREFRQEPCISFARNASGEIAFIEDVARGLACCCTCLTCNEPLVARQGRHRRWSFAHQSTGTSECEWAAETALHFAMKEIINQERKIFVPSIAITVEGKTNYGDPVKKSFTKQGQLVPLDSVELEYTFHPIRPDVVAYAGGHRLLIEAVVTHDVDETKIRYLRQLNASTVKIDLSKYDRAVDRQALRAVLLEERNEKTWAFYRKRDEIEINLRKELDQLIFEKEKAHAEHVERRLRERHLEKAYSIERLNLPDNAPFADGAVMCFRLRDGGDVYLRRSPQGRLVLEFTELETNAVAEMSRAALVRSGNPAIWMVPENALFRVIPLLNSLSITTTNRTRSDYRRYRYGG